MRIKVVVVKECPNGQLAVGRLRQALEASGLDEADVVTRVVTDQAEVERIGFTGPPTILIDGEDPFAEAGRAQGMTRRLYRTPEGLGGAPSISQLHHTLTTTSRHS
ncbi:DsbA family protein [Streptomyces sp. NPDC056231]|uniref:DsbA family protein n=1 Tax=Streptomyces sp. NPDC056231 TaxID=3345755 RepID=UPI003AAA7985